LREEAIEAIVLPLQSENQEEKRRMKGTKEEREKCKEKAWELYTAPTGCKTASFFYRNIKTESGAKPFSETYWRDIVREFDQRLMKKDTETGLSFVSFRFVSFRFVSFRFVFCFYYLFSF